jgi:hypothetical protein
MAAALIASAGSGAQATEPAAVLGGKVVFTGMCEAAAGSALDERRIVLADRAGSVLRVYDVVRGGAPLASSDLASRLEWTAPAGGADIRGGTRLGEQTFWITSHARGSDGRRDPARSRFFATAASGNGEGLQVVGRPYGNLRKELLKVPELYALGKSVRKRGPLEAGGIDLAALAGDTDGRSLLIGFRTPVVDGHALVLPLLNPAQTIAGEAPQFGRLRRMNLDGLGIAELLRWRDRFVVVAVPIGDVGPPRFFVWDGTNTTARPMRLDLAGRSPSAAVVVGGRLMLLLGEGSTRSGPCGIAGHDRDKRLHAVWVSLP